MNDKNSIEIKHILDILPKMINYNGKYYDLNINFTRIGLTLSYSTEDCSRYIYCISDKNYLNASYKTLYWLTDNDFLN